MILNDGTTIVAVDVGGTNARFALATLSTGQPPKLGSLYRYDTAAWPDLAGAWAQFLKDSGAEGVKAASIAVAGPVGGDTIKFTNNPWVFRPATLAQELGLDGLLILNDFGAMAHAVHWLRADESRRIAGPAAWPESGVTTIIGPGTGLGVAMTLRRDGHIHAIETEGSHIDFAPLDSFETRIADRLRERFRRCSVERLVSGPGLASIREAIAAFEGLAIVPGDDKTLWANALDGGDPVAARALERLVLIFGAVTGDLALAQGANAVMIVGGLSNRMADLLAAPAFADRFAAKGRHETRMRNIAIRLCTHEQPGLLGAAAAFQAEYLRA